MSNKSKSIEQNNESNNYNKHNNDSRDNYGNHISDYNWNNSDHDDDKVHYQNSSKIDIQGFEQTHIPDYNSNHKQNIIPNMMDISIFIDVCDMIHIHERYMQLSEVERMRVIYDICNNIVLSLSWIEICIIVLLIDDKTIQIYLDKYNKNMYITTLSNVKLKLWVYVVRKMILDLHPDIATEKNWSDPTKWNLKSREKFSKKIINIMKNASFKSVKQQLLNMINHNMIDKGFDKNQHKKFKKDIEYILKSDEFYFIEYMSDNIFNKEKFDINKIIFYTGWQIKIMDYCFFKFYECSELVIPIIADVNSNFTDIVVDVMTYIDQNI